MISVNFTIPCTSYVDKRFESRLETVEFIEPLEVEEPEQPEEEVDEEISFEVVDKEGNQKSLDF